MTEDQWRPKVVGRLKRQLKGSLWFPIPRTVYGRSGVSDIIGCYQGRFIAIELKRADSNWAITRTQAAFLRDVVRADGEAYVAYNDPDIALIILYIREGGVLTPVNESAKIGGRWVGA